MDHLTDTIAIHLTNLSMNERQQILETTNLNERMLKVASLLKKELEIQKTEQSPGVFSYIKFTGGNINIPFLSSISGCKEYC